MSDKYIFDTIDPDGEKPRWPGLMAWTAAGGVALGFFHLPEILETAHLVYWNIISLTAD